MLDVHEQELLVLLLMVQAELEQVGRGAGERTVEDLAHHLVDMVPVLGYLGDARTRHETPFGPRMSLADRLVVRVEDVAIGRMERRVGAELPGHDEGFEEPRRVTAVPFRRARV